MEISKNHFVFSKNFLNFMFNGIEKQSIVNLSHCRSKSYVPVVLGDFLGKGRMQPFAHFSTVFC